jgi:hypothetical protein
VTVVSGRKRGRGKRNQGDGASATNEGDGVGERQKVEACKERGAIRRVRGLGEEAASLSSTVSDSTY